MILDNPFQIFENFEYVCVVFDDKGKFVKFLLSGIIRGSKYASEEEALKAPCGK